MTTTDIGPLTWRERGLILDDRIRRAKRKAELISGMVKITSGEDSEILFDAVVEAKREEGRLQDEKKI